MMTTDVFGYKANIWVYKVSRRSEGSICTRMTLNKLGSYSS